MAHDFVTDQRAYRDDNGDYVSRQQLRDKIEKLIDFVKKHAADTADRYKSGDISIVEFETEMRDLLKSAHILASSVGRGGREMMTQSDWGKVGNSIKSQYEYLSRFARKLGSSDLTKAYSENRARSYASSIYISFSTAEQEAKTENVPGAQNPDQIFATLVQNSAEGCIECSSDADAGPQPVEDVAPIGDRLCGDFCLCFLEFTDADGNEI